MENGTVEKTVKTNFDFVDNNAKKLQERLQDEYRNLSEDEEI